MSNQTQHTVNVRAKVSDIGSGERRQYRFLRSVGFNPEQASLVVWGMCLGYAQARSAIDLLQGEATMGVNARNDQEAK